MTEYPHEIASTVKHAQDQRVRPDHTIDDDVIGNGDAASVATEVVTTGTPGQRIVGQHAQAADHGRDDPLGRPRVPLSRDMAGDVVEVAPSCRDKR